MRRKGKWTRIHREDMNPYMFDGVRCEACKMCFGLPTPYCPNCGAKMQDNEDFEVGILVEVVRCKDCERVSFDYHDEQYPCFCDKWLQGVEYDDYCSYRERRDEN